MPKGLVAGLLAALALRAEGAGQDQAPSQDPQGLEFFEQKIRPVLESDPK